MKFPNGISAWEMFMKVWVSSISKVSVVSAVHHLYHYATEDLLASIGLIWSDIATTQEANRLESVRNPNHYFQDLTLITMVSA